MFLLSATCAQFKSDCILAGNKGMLRKMCEFFSKTRTCPSQAKNIPICQKSALGVFQFLQSILYI